MTVQTHRNIEMSFRKCRMNGKAGRVQMTIPYPPITLADIIILILIIFVFGSNDGSKRKKSPLWHNREVTDTSKMPKEFNNTGSGTTTLQIEPKYLLQLILILLGLNKSEQKNKSHIETTDQNFSDKSGESCNPDNTVGGEVIVMKKKGTFNNRNKKNNAVSEGPVLLPAAETDIPTAEVKGNTSDISPVRIPEVPFKQSEVCTQASSSINNSIDAKSTLLQPSENDVSHIYYDENQLEDIAEHILPTGLPAYIKRDYRGAKIQAVLPNAVVVEGEVVFNFYGVLALKCNNTIVFVNESDVIAFF